MQRIFVLVFGIACALGLATFAVAQDASPTPSPSIACGSPVAATPGARTPVPARAASGTPEATPTACNSAASEVTIELVDIAFKPAEVTISAGVPATITLVNNGLALHNFNLAELGINVDLGPGESQTVTVTAPVGDYTFICNIPGHVQAGMAGVLHVE